MSSPISKENPLDLLRSMRKLASNPTEKEFFTRTYINGENTVTVLKEMRLDETYVEKVINNIARQARKPVGETTNG